MPALQPEGKAAMEITEQSKVTIIGPDVERHHRVLDTSWPKDLPCKTECVVADETAKETVGQHLRDFMKNNKAIFDSKVKKGEVKLSKVVEGQGRSAYACVPAEVNLGFNFPETWQLVRPAISQVWVRLQQEGL